MSDNNALAWLMLPLVAVIIIILAITGWRDQEDAGDCARRFY